MILKILGSVDVLVGINFLLLGLGINFKGFLIFVAIYLILKSLFFLKNLLSILDLIAALILVLSIFSIHLTWPVYIIFAILLFQKGAFSISS